MIKLQFHYIDVDQLVREHGQGRMHSRVLMFCMALLRWRRMRMQCLIAFE